MASNGESDARDTNDSGSRHVEEDADLWDIINVNQTNQRITYKQGHQN